MKRLITAFLLLLLLGATMAGEDDNVVDTDAVKAKMGDYLAAKTAGKNATNGGNLPELHSPFKIPDSDLNEANKANKQDAISEYFDHVTETNHHQRDVFQWQLLSSRILFIIVLVLVIAGIYFAAVQFHKDLRQGKEGAASTIRFGQDGIEVSSSVLGVIILVISLVFFYLYLVFIYPIEFVK